MNKKFIIFITIFSAIIILFVGIFIYSNYINKQKNISNKDNNYLAQKINNEENIAFNSNNTNSENLSTSDDKTAENVEVPIHETESYVPTETELSSFSTKIYNQEESRQNNIRLVINALNGSIVKSGGTFSFTSIVGPATTEKGYKKANVIDKDGNNVPRSWWSVCVKLVALYIMLF